jgi:metallo-beta-lactamase family protein
MSFLRITLYGAAGEVTGSAYLVETPAARLLIDFGQFQGGRDAERKNRVPPGLDPRRLDAVVLTHAHLDHTGRLPLLVRAGYRGPIYATPATIDVTKLLLRDSAKIQENDAERINRKRQRAGQPLITPLFNDEDVDRLERLLRPLPYGEPVEVAPSLRVRARESGHLLGSASLELIAERAGRTATLAFSGDVGPRGMPMLEDPDPPERADLVFLESTYGDRDHRPYDQTKAEFAELLRSAVAQRGKILIPAFAVGRTQQLLYELAELFRSGVVPPFPVYVDSPMATSATQIYLRHPELADDEATKLLDSRQLRHDLATLEFTESVDESRALNALEGPCMIIAGSGMCTGGRILHHLRQSLWRPETAVMIVGYQAHGTLGRQLAEGAPRVKIFGEPIIVRAKVATIGGFSAHAGQRELLEWLATLAQGQPRVQLTHGEDDARAALAARIAERYGIRAELPAYEARVEL